MCLLDDGEPLKNPSKYKRLVEKLFYLTVIRPNITFGVQQLCQFLSQSTDKHWKLAIGILRYLKGTLYYQLQFTRCQRLLFSAFSDSNWGCCLDFRKSLSGYCIFLGGCLISRKTKKQATVAKSTAKVEYRTVTTTVAEVLWIFYVLRILTSCILVMSYFIMTTNPVFKCFTNPLTMK